MDILHLTPAEQQLFHSLPPDVREGWQMISEDLTYNDTPQKRELRLALLRVHDPKLQAFRQKVQVAQTVEEVAALIRGMDLRDVADDDIAHLFFAVGPSYLGSIIEHVLSHVRTDEDVEDVAMLSTVRHTILEAFHSVTHA